MKAYDIIVIGSGSGDIILENAMDHGLKCALVDRGPLGGTCLNVGCIPSKMLILPADRIMELERDRRLGLDVQLRAIDYASIVTRMMRSVKEEREHMREGLKATPGLDYYEEEGHFVADYTLEVGGQRIKGKQVFIAAGSRPLIPPIPGIQDVDYLTNETVLTLTRPPGSLIIIGGGYIAVEYAHFFAAMGTEVTIIEMLDRLIAHEEPEVSDVVREALGRRMKVYTGMQAVHLRQEGNEVTLAARERAGGAERQFQAERVMVAVGRRSNADLLKLENTGVEVDQKGYIKVNEYLETTKKDIWAVGDVNGKQPFTHTANRQAMAAWHNSHGAEKNPVDFSMTPYAIFTWPQVAGVGMTEAEAAKSHKILVGRAMYADVAYGDAMMERDGFAKAIVDAETEKILGFHIAGPHAATLIQEVINAMAMDGTVEYIGAGLHIHPALPELIVSTLATLEEPGEVHEHHDEVARVRGTAT